MTSVLANTVDSSANAVHSRSLWKLTSAAALLAKIWWHAKAYGTSLKILVLIAGSMVLLHTHWSCRRLLLSRIRPNPTDESSKLVRSQQHDFGSDL